jgi:hypothetical protein
MSTPEDTPYEPSEKISTAHDYDKAVRANKVIMGLTAAVIGLTAISPFAYDTSKNYLTDMRSYELTDYDAYALNTAAKSGIQALRGFEPGDWPRLPSGYVVPLEPTPLGHDMLVVDPASTLTATSDENGSYVTKVSDFNGAGWDKTETMVLRNPNRTMFGYDGTATAEEIITFYKNSATELVSYDSHEPDGAVPGCDIDITVRNKVMRTNAPEQCPNLISSSDAPGIIMDVSNFLFQYE